MTCFGPKTPDMGGFCRRICRCFLLFVAIVAVIIVLCWLFTTCRENLLAAGLSLAIVAPFAIGSLIAQPYVERMMQREIRAQERERRR